MHKAITRRGLDPNQQRLSWSGVGWLLLYYVGLLASYYLVVAPQFGYIGFDQNPPKIGTAVLLVLPYVLCARQLPGSWHRPSTIIYWMLFLVVVAPLHVLPVYTTYPPATLWLALGTVAGAFWLLGLIYRFEPPTIPRPTMRPRAYWMAYIGLWLLLTGIVMTYYGVQVQWVSLSEIYQVRDVFKQASEDAPMFARYSVSWLGNVIAPIAIARGLLTRRWVWLGAGIATELFLFSLTGFKQMMFASALVVVVVLLVKVTDIRRIGRWFAMIVGVGVVAVTLVDWLASRSEWLASLTGGGEISSVLIRRMVLTTALNTGYYVEFFSDHPPAMLGHSVLGRFVEYPYGLNPALLIGLVYYGNPRMSANANIWADAFANFGVVGIIGFTAILAIALLVVDGITKNSSPGLGLSAMSLSSFSFTNTAMLTVFLTHGFGLAVVVLYFMPSDDVGPPVGPGADRGRIGVKRRRPGEDRNARAGVNAGPTDESRDGQER